MGKINFSSDNTRAVFAEKDFDQFKALMFDAANGTQKVSKEEADAKIREVMFEVLGVDENCKPAELKKAIRRHKIDIFEVIEETIQDLLVSGWQDNPFFNQFVEMKSMAIGDTNEFYVEDDVILTVSEVSGNHHDLMRQRLGEGQTFSVKTSWYGVKIYAEFERFVTGKVDWAGFINKIYEAFDKKINDTVYVSVMSAGTQVKPSAQFNINGTLTRDKMI